MCVFKNLTCGLLLLLLPPSSKSNDDRRSRGVSGSFGNVEIFPPRARFFSFSDRDHIDALSLVSDGRDERRERGVLLVLCEVAKEEKQK
jgi:hypothetical protein